MLHLRAQGRDLRSALRERLAELSPRRRRWLRFLADLPLQVDHLPKPVEAPSPDDFIICGCPRTGTTLVAAMLFQPPEVVVAMEPWDGMRLPPADLFRSLRSELAETGELRRGRLDLVALHEQRSVRWCKEGATPLPVEVNEPYRLGVKWPGYWRLISLLPDTRFIVCIRHPAEVVASFRDAGGRVAQGLQYATRFNADLNSELSGRTDDPAVRRILLFDYVHERLLPLLSSPNVHVVRYENWYDGPQAELAGLGSFLGASLGAPRVDLKRHAQPRLSPSEVALLRRHCRTAAALGYEL